MKKRILCVLLTLIMLVGLIPAGALTASAAGLSTSASGITVLKQLEGYSKYCRNGYTGYGTLCTKSGDHDDHVTSEKEASEALNNELKVLDKAVNSFASRNGLALSQSQHDALVLFSFENGTAWTTGTGDFQNAVKSGARGSAFLNAICWWDSSIADDDRRRIEANMYLNGVYNTTVPSSRFIRVKYEVNGGEMSEAVYQYYDTAEKPTADIIPSRQYHFFMGWYDKADGGKQVTSLNKSRTVYAHWQSYVEEPGEFKNVDYILEAKNQTRLYYKPQGNKTDYHVKGNLTIDSEFIDNNNVRWAHVCRAQKAYKDGKKVGEGLRTNGWIKLGEVDFQNQGGIITDYDMDVTVTVTNDYVRVRAEDSIYSKELRRANRGEQLRIVNTSSNDGFLWGQIADSDNDGVCEGWVALLYTNFEEVRGGSDNSNATYKVIATATVVKPVNGYVNVRNGAGTNNQIVGALPYQSRVDIYEITYVNGIQWGRYSGGWFCLAYADVEGIDVDDYSNNSNVLAYAFIGDLKDTWSVYEEPKSTASLTRVKDTFGNKNLTITNLTREESTGITWGKISEGWVKLTNADGTIADVTLDVAKYYTVVDGVTVRTAPETSASRVNNLVKGVEFNVNEKYQILVVGDTIWGYADKVGEDEKTYSGWINLASKYVARGDAPAAGSNKKDDEPTGEMATIVGADKVNVRIHHDIYSKILGKISRGTTVAILGEEDGWYKLDYDVDNNDETDSWVSGKYVEVSKASSNNGNTGSNNNTDGSGTVETGLGIVANTYSGVNVRTGPGTGYAATGKLLPGTTVEILEVTTGGASKWGRVKEGWICMDYVTMVTNYEVLDAITGNGGTGNTTSTAEVAIYTGTANGTVTIYKTTSEESDVVRTIGSGEPITLHEILTVTYEKVTSTTTSGSTTTTTTETVTEYWARVNDGYIKDPATNLSLDAMDEAVYTVTESETLNVRNAAGTQGTSIVYKLKKGDQVVVTRVQIINGNVWGFIEADADKTYITDEDGNKTTEFDWNGEGWISLAYTTKGAVSIKNETAPEATTPPTTPPLGVGSDNGGYVNNATGYRYTGKVINTNSLNVRATASQTAAKTTVLANGASLVIYETVISEGMAWGRCDAGWVYLYYVDLTPVVNGAVDARVVYNENTIAYTDMNCSEVAGTYAKMSVIDIYEIVGKMARTELGWVNTDNLL